MQLSKVAVAGLLLCVCAAGQASQAGTDVSPTQLASIVRNLEAAQRQSRTDAGYLVTREYRLIDTRSSRVNSQVVAQVQYLPPGPKTYVIQTRTGSGRGEQVVKRILDHESEMSRRSSQSAAAAISQENYDFTYLGADSIDGNACHVVGLQPKRKEKELIVGRAWVDTKSFLIRRIEGDMAKTPSWLLKKVHVTLDFADISGMWVQTAMRADADVRFVGDQTLQSKMLDYRAASEVAAQATSRRSRTYKRPIPAELLLRPNGLRR